MRQDRRAQLERHNRDEAKARQVQQQAAGVSHSPVLEDNGGVADARERDKVAAETQRCAALADAWTSAAQVTQRLGPLNEAEINAAVSVARALAAEIRGVEQAPRAPPRA